MDLINLIQTTNSTYGSYWCNQLQKKMPEGKARALEQKIRFELENIELRKSLINRVKVSYQSELPVSQEVDKIKQMLQEYQLLIVCGETGSGKTTQLPKILLELGYGQGGLIGHTQPRRIAAKSLASRISDELGITDKESGLVGYKMRFHDKTQRHTAIKLMTDGILLQEIQKDKLLLQYSALIIDEVHERSLNIDFILGYLKQLLPKRKDLKVIITSATLENEKISNFFVDAPILNVSGKTYPVDIVYQPVVSDDGVVNLNQEVYQAICAALAVERGNGLVFLPGEREIKDCLSYLRKTELKTYLLLPLYSRQNSDEQAKIFANDGSIKIILATNIAETSLTIPGIKFVIDSGLARIKRYSIRNRVEQLQIEPISQASCKQRAGRAGRVSHGLCVRLFSQEEYAMRRQFSEPELMRSNLANVILRLLSLNLGDPLQFPFLDMPEAKAYSDGFRTLYQVGAIDAQNRITSTGRKLAQIPIDIQLAKILITAADKFSCLREALIIVAFLAIQDPREYPLEQQQLARERHSLWADKESEFIQILNLWHWYHSELQHKKSNRKLAETCHKQFVSLVRLREWHELHRQLKEVMLGLGYRENIQPFGYQQLHSAILSGFVVNIGQRDLVEKYYLGTNSKKFFLHPSSRLDNPKWIVASTLVETSRLYARNCAKIDARWLVGIADHLVKYTYHGEKWDKNRGEVTSIQSTLLYGLLIQQQRVSFSRINPKLAQEIFIKEGLVPSEINKKYPFLEHNLQVVKKVEKLEDKLRTSLVILDDELYDFYASRLPPEVLDLPSLENFIKDSPDYLKINQQQLIDRLTSDISQLELYPDQLISNDQKISLKYVFDHESNEDGLIAIINLPQLVTIDNHIFEWLVPGMIREKVAFIIKSLPKNQRLLFSPLQESITEFLELADTNQPLFLQFIHFAQARKKINLSYPELERIKFPTQLCCHFRIIDQKKIVATGDDLALIKKQLAPNLSKLVVKHSSKEQINKITGFIPEFSKLLQRVELDGNGRILGGYYSLIVEKNNEVSFGVVTDLPKARQSSLRGLAKLIRLQLRDQEKYIQNKKIDNFREVSLAFISIYTQDELVKASTDYIINIVILPALERDFPQDENQFEALVTFVRSNIGQALTEFSGVMNRIAECYQKIKLELEEHPLADFIQAQLDDLIYPEFLAYTKWRFLANFPRYLQAIIFRMQKYSKAPVRDEEFEEQISDLYDRWYNYVDDLENKHKLISSELYDFKYKIEELRISLFAQEIKTLYPVSVKRLSLELEQLYQGALSAT